MKKTIFIIIFILCNSSYAQLQNERSKIIAQVVKLFEKENAKLYYQIKNDHYERELDLMEKKRTKSDSKISEYLNIDYKEFKRIFFKTNNTLLSKYYSTTTTKDLKEKNIAILSIPIISEDNKKAIIYGRYSCGLFCGKMNIFYFEKMKEKWVIRNIEQF